MMDTRKQLLALKSINILGKPFTFEFFQEQIAPDEETGLDYAALGFSDGINLKIKLNSEQNPIRMKETALHEILHELCNAIGNNLTEEQVTGLSSVLWCFFVQNPDIIPILFNTDTPVKSS